MRGRFTTSELARALTEIDRVVEFVLEEQGVAAKLLDFSPYGYDERQFNSPGIAAPVGRLTRTPNGEYEEYHSSADNLDFVRPEYLEESLRVLERVVTVLEGQCPLPKYGTALRASAWKARPLRLDRRNSTESSGSTQCCGS